MNEDIRSKTFGILIHHLPLEFCEEVFKLFSEKYVLRVILDRDTGLQVYFNKYEYAREIIIKQKIQIKGISYTVYPLVTNITVYNIRYYEFKSEVLKLLSYYGRIIDQYAIKDCSERVTADYRIILDVPEVLADFNFPYLLHLPSDTRHSFRVEFFCRLCRENGHKQYECPKHFPPSREEDGCFRKCLKTKDTFESNDGEQYLPHNSRYLGQNRRELEDYSKDVRSSKRRITCGKKTNNFSDRDDSLSSEIQQMDCSDAKLKKNYYFAGYRRCHKQENNDRKKRDGQKNKETKILSNYLSPEMLRSIVNDAKAQKQHTFTSGKETNNFSERDDSLSREIQQMDCSYAKLKKQDYFAGYTRYRRCHKQENNDSKEQGDQKNEETEALSNYLSTEMLRSIVNDAKAQKQHKHSVIKTDNNNLQERVTFDATLKHKNTHHESVDTKCKHLNQNKGCNSKEETICEWRSIEEVVPNTSIPNNTIPKKAINNCKIKGSPIRRRQSDPLMNMQPVRTAFCEELLTKAYVTEPKDISPKMEQELRILLQHLKSVKNGNSELRSRRDFLDRFLDRVVRERRILKRSIIKEMKPKGTEPTRSSERQPSDRSSRTKKTELSLGIKNVISKVRGVLPPPELCKFLNQVRCRRKKLEIARYFTTKISDLALQLLDVVRAYYVQGDKGYAEDIDIRFIKSVVGVLKADIDKTAAPIVKIEPISEI